MMSSKRSRRRVRRKGWRGRIGLRLTKSKLIIKALSPPCGLTEEGLLIACRNVGVNLECSRVASIFYNGVSNVECDCGGCHVPQLQVEIS